MIPKLIWRGITYSISEDKYECLPQQTPQQILEWFQTAIELNEYILVDNMVQQGLKWKYLSKEKEIKFIEID